MKKISYVCFGLSLIIAGCGTFGIKQIRKSEASQEYAKRTFSKYDYKSLMAKMDLPRSEVKSLGPVQLYSVTNDFLSIDQNSWFYIQSVVRTDGLECYAYIQVVKDGEANFKNYPGSFYCFKNENSFFKVDL